VLETEGADRLFGEPALALADLIRTDASGKGMVNVIAAERLMQSPRLYATFLLWLMSELFEQLPEVGDPAKPVAAFFFDEAHLLFDDAPPALVGKIEQVARLIRSKGVSVWFCTQNPADLPESVLGQLGNRVQHGLRAFTARDQKALRQAAETYRPNPAFDIAEAIGQVGVGEAVTSFLERKGAPGMAERTLIRPPSSQLGPLDPAVRARLIAASPVAGKYDTAIDRESAYEMLKKRADAASAEAEASSGASPEAAPADDGYNHARRYDPTPRSSKDYAPKTTKSTRSKKEPDSFGSALGEAVIKELKGTTGRRIVRGIFGTFFRSR